MAHVWLYNPDTDAKWECPPDYAYIARARGWVDTDAPVDEYADLEDNPEPSPYEDPDDVQTSFDPSEHNVAEVLEYLDEYRHDSPGEVERVLGLERAGKNRVTITGD